MNISHLSWDDSNLSCLLFSLFSNISPRGKSVPEREIEVREDVANGFLPSLDRYYTKSKDPNIAAIVEAMLMCFNPNPTERSTAKEVAQYLEDAENKITASREVKRKIAK